MTFIETQSLWCRCPRALAPLLQWLPSCCQVSLRAPLSSHLLFLLLLFQVNCCQLFLVFIPYSQEILSIFLFLIPVQSFRYFKFNAGSYKTAGAFAFKLQHTARPQAVKSLEHQKRKQPGSRPTYSQSVQIIDSTNRCQTKPLSRCCLTMNQLL